MVRGRSQECERTRASVSAALDGELSELESLRMRSHLSGCEACREFQESAQFSTTALRMARLEPLTRPLALPSRRRRSLGARLPGAAAPARLVRALGGPVPALHGGAPTP